MRTHRCGNIQSGTFNHKRQKKTGKRDLSSVTFQIGFWTTESEPLIDSLERYYLKKNFMVKTKWDIDLSFWSKYIIIHRNVGQLVWDLSNSLQIPIHHYRYTLNAAGKLFCVFYPRESWFKGPISALCGPTPAHWSKQGQKFTAVGSELIANVFTTFLGNMEESSSVCATAVGGSSAIPHMPSLSHCHGSLTLGENEHSKRFPPQYYLSLLFTPSPLFSFHRLSPSHLNSLLSLGGPAL